MRKQEKGAELLPSLEARQHKCFATCASLWGFSNVFPVRPSVALWPNGNCCVLLALPRLAARKPNTYLLTVLLQVTERCRARSRSIGDCGALCLLLLSRPPSGALLEAVIYGRVKVCFLAYGSVLMTILTEKKFNWLFSHGL